MKKSKMVGDWENDVMPGFLDDIYRLGEVIKEHKYVKDAKEIRAETLKAQTLWREYQLACTFCASPEEQQEKWNAFWDYIKANMRNWWD